MNELALFAGDMKTCSKCRQSLPLTEFYKRSKGNTHHSACKACERQMAKGWYAENREAAKAKYKAWREENIDSVKAYRRANREKHYRQEVARKYGVELNWFDAKLAEQENKCACCKREFKWGNKQTTPHVDHCHKTGVVRGILCNRCNTVLGLCEDGADLLVNLAGYLNKWHG